MNDASCKNLLRRYKLHCRGSLCVALALLEANFLERARIVTLDGHDYRVLLRRAAGGGVAGGRAYDALIAECARKLRTPVFLTFNVDHFLDLEAFGMQVLMPTVEAQQ